MALIVLSVAVTAVAVIALGQTLYAFRFHPLRAFPGPKIWAVTQLPWHLNNMAGKLAFRLEKLHNEYGPVVRVGPNELSFVATSISTWRAIYSRRPHEMPKSLGGTGLHPPYNGVPGIEVSDSLNHPRIRKALSPAFSDRALRDQEAFINRYIDKLMQILHQASDSRPQDFAKLFNWIAFDIVGDLALGQSFGGLDEQTYHPWVATIFDGIKAIAFLQFVLFYRLERLLHALTPGHLAEQRDRFYALAFEKTDARLRRREDRKDFVSCMDADQDGKAVMSRQEMHTTFSTLLVAGSESSATTIGGAVYLTLFHPQIFRKLRDEIRTAFSDKNDVTIQATNQLEYLTCVLQETFRVYPPAPATIPRVVPAPGETIDGHWVPSSTVVGINQWSTYHAPCNFVDPNSFIPERWLPEGKRPSRFEHDRRSVLQPFSYGPRDCLGKTLANAEVRLILSRLLVEFDLELSPETRDWTNQLQFLTWEKKPLMVFAKPRTKDCNISC